MKSTLILARSGCLLPFLIIFNLTFGWLFLKPLAWLGLEAILILLFLLTSLILTKRVVSASMKNRKNDIIDVDAEVVDETKKLH